MRVYVTESSSRDLLLMILFLVMAIAAVSCQSLPETRCRKAGLSVREMNLTERDGETASASIKCVRLVDNN